MGYSLSIEVLALGFKEEQAEIEIKSCDQIRSPDSCLHLGGPGRQAGGAGSCGRQNATRQGLKAVWRSPFLDCPVLHKDG